MEVDASRFLMSSYVLKTRIVYSQKLITESDYFHWILHLHYPPSPRPTPPQARSVGNRRTLMVFVCGSAMA